MKFQVFSDIHSEFHSASSLVTFSQKLNPKNEDRIALVAGDQKAFRTNNLVYTLLADEFTKVICVLGNHDFWGGEADSVLDKTREAVKDLSNVHILENDIHEVKGRRILGCTGWFPGPLSSRERREWVDFRMCKGLGDKATEYNAKSKEFLQQTLPGDIVMTHHIPNDALVHPAWRGAETNKFFVSDFELKPCALQVWGHTHDSTVRDHYVCNPYGYYGQEVNPDFRYDMIVEL